MKKHEWLDRLGGIDPTYIEESDPGKGQTKAAAVSLKQRNDTCKSTCKSTRKSGRRWPMMIAACLSIVMLLSVAVYLLPASRTHDFPWSRPGGDETVGETAEPITLNPIFPGTGSHDYTHVIQKLDAYNNSFDNSIDFPNSPGVEEDVDDGAPGATPSTPDNATPIETEGVGSPEEEPSDDPYVEVTDNQVAGVIESDIIKRTQTHIFFLRNAPRDVYYFGHILEIYTIDKENSKLIGSYTLDEYVKASDFYLSADGKTVTIIARPAQEWIMQTIILSLDVSDPANICEKGRVTIDGYLESTRMSGGRLLVVTNYYGWKYMSDYDETDPTTFIPCIDYGDGQGSVCLAPEDVCVPVGNIANRDHTVAVSLNEADLTVTDQISFLSYSGPMYVTKDSIYLTSNIDGYSFTTGDSTENYVLGMYYVGGSFGYRGEGCFKGTLLNQYSMDEYNGILRVVTTVRHNGLRNASLFCIDLSTWQTVAAVENFAPEGEQVFSVRFDGDKAYVCTAVQTIDPVFYFDLSDLQNITVKDTGEIAGFSTSLIQLGDGYLLGVGEDAEGSFKLEVYKESDAGVVSVATYSHSKPSAMDTTYKSFLIDREKGLFGFSFYEITYNKDASGFYCLLKFDKETETFRELTIVVIPPNEYGRTLAFDNRALLIDGYLYLFINCSNMFHVEKIDGV